MPIKCIKCGVTSRRRAGIDPETYICEDCRQHEKLIISLYETAKETFSDPSAQIETSDVYEILKQSYFIIQKNPKLSIYSTIVKELLEAFVTQNLSELDYEELWRRVRSARNILKILTSMEEAGVVIIESPDRISRVIKPGPVLENFATIYKAYKTEEHARTRVSSVLAMYVVLHELYILALAQTRDEIRGKFGPHPPKAPWIATMFLWSKRLEKDGDGRSFTEEEIRKFFARRGLSPTTISNYISALKAISPHSVQQLIENINPGGENGVTFIVREDIIRTLERLYGERVRESDRA